MCPDCVVRCLFDSVVIDEIFSYRFGFVTFETEEEAQYVLQKVSNTIGIIIMCDASQ